MDLDELNVKEVMHIDTSSKLYEKKSTGIAYKTVKAKTHKGLALKLSLKKDLERDLSIGRDYARIYAICIYYLIKDELNNFDILVICGDEHFESVRRYLDYSFLGNEEYQNKMIISMAKLREITGKPKLKSYADKISNAYRKRALRSRTIQQKGNPLNVIKVNYRMIKDMWTLLERVNKKDT